MDSRTSTLNSRRATVVVGLKPGGWAVQNGIQVGDVLFECVGEKVIMQSQILKSEVQFSKSWLAHAGQLLRQCESTRGRATSDSAGNDIIRRENDIRSMVPQAGTVTRYYRDYIGY